MLWFGSWERMVQLMPNDGVISTKNRYRADGMERNWDKFAGEQEQRYEVMPSCDQERFCPDMFGRSGYNAIPLQFDNDWFAGNW